MRANRPTVGEWAPPSAVNYRLPQTVEEPLHVILTSSHISSSSTTNTPEPRCPPCSVNPQFLTGEERSARDHEGSQL